MQASRNSWREMSALVYAVNQKPDVSIQNYFLVHVRTTLVLAEYWTAQANLAILFGCSQMDLLPPLCEFFLVSRTTTMLQSIIFLFFISIIFFLNCSRYVWSCQFSTNSGSSCSFLVVYASLRKVRSQTKRPQKCLLYNYV